MNPDHDLRQLFRQQREADTQRVPAFSRLTRVPAESPWSVPWLRLATVAAAVVVLGVSVTMWRRSAQPPAVNTESWAALSNWQAPTDALLTVSSAPWGSTMTTPSDFWIETTTQTEQKETTL